MELERKTEEEEEEDGCEMTPSSPYQDDAHEYLSDECGNIMCNGQRSSMAGRIRDCVTSTFFLRSLGGYERPPGQDDDEDAAFVDESSDQEKRTRQEKGVFLHKCLWMGILLVGIFGAYSSVTKEPHPYIYTGDSSTRGKEVTILENLESVSTLHNMEHGVVASDHPACSAIGLSILREHQGNAVDAAVATVLCLGVANPSSSGIGGGAFILIHTDARQHPQDEHNISSPKFHDARNSEGDTSILNQQGGKVTEVIDCREVAGSAASTEMFETEGVPAHASLFGGLAVAVPGELRGLELAHARHGRLDWATVVRPAMELARDGVTVYTHLAADIQLAKRKQERWGGAPFLRKLLTHDDNWDHPLLEGDLLKNLRLSTTLQAVMDEGSDAIHTGKRAEQLADEIQQAGGILTKDDLENYRPTIRSPVVSDSVFGMNVVGVPPPSSGGAVIIGALRFLAGFGTQVASFADTSVHVVEALKHAFAIRMTMGDPAFPLGNEVTNATTQDAVEALIRGPYMEELRLDSSSADLVLNLSHYGGPRFAQLHDSDGQSEGKDAKEGDRRRLLRENQQQRRLFNRFGYLEDRGTSHISVVDTDLNAVAITTSVNTQFGSGIVSSGGFVLNNQMDDFGNPGSANLFGLKPAEANFIKPGKKPLSSMSPTMLFEAQVTMHASDGSSSKSLGDLRMVVGGSGGPKIISAVLQVIVNHIYLGKDLFESMAHPRVHNQLIYHGSADTTVENSMVEPAGINLRLSQEARSALKKRGNRLVDIDYAGTVQAITVDPRTDKLNAVSDIRKGGSPAGY